MRRRRIRRKRRRRRSSRRKRKRRERERKSEISQRRTFFLEKLEGTMKQGHKICRTFLPESKAEG
jgi:hypothetical protein